MCIYASHYKAVFPPCNYIIFFSKERVDVHSYHVYVTNFWYGMNYGVS